MRQALPLSAELRALRDLFRRYVSSHQRPTIDACRELTMKFALMTESAGVLEARAREADELEEVARDLDLAATAALSPSVQAALKDEQRAIQAQLDAGGGLGPVHVQRPAGLAALAMPVGDTNVVSFPRGPRPQPVDCQGDDGDVA